MAYNEYSRMWEGDPPPSNNKYGPSSQPDLWRIPNRYASERPMYDYGIVDETGKLPIGAIKEPVTATLPIRDVSSKYLATGDNKMVDSSGTAPWVDDIKFGDNGRPYSNVDSSGALVADKYYEVDGQGRDYMSSPVPLLARNTDYAAFSLGQALGAPKGTPGRGLGIAAGIGDFAIGAGRNFVSGLADSKDYTRTYTDMMRRQNELGRRFTENRTQYTDPNYRGKYGGKKGYYEDGGEMSQEQAQAMMQQMMQQQQGQPKQQVQQPQQQQAEQQGAQEQQIVEIATELIQQFQGDMQKIQQFLEQEGVEDSIIEMVLMYAQEMVGGQQQQQQQEQLPNPQGSSVMRNTMNRRMDMPMDFGYGGRKKYPKL